MCRPCCQNVVGNAGRTWLEKLSKVQDREMGSEMALTDPVVMINISLHVSFGIFLGCSVA